MKREVHLICNAHIDPMWLWEWEEGAAEAISTFRTAARLLEENNDYIFCHNEALIYSWIKEYEPSLFERIQKLVKAGKWRIIGGYFLQPDCNIPSGEAMIRQIEAGNSFFKEYFDVDFKTAINFDSFGHSRGLVQIMKKKGYENYLICRPTKHNKTDIPNEFTWVGYDSSTINLRRHYELYGSALGHAVDKLKYNLEYEKESPLMILWGVGNHGGGPSKKDIDDLNQFISEVKSDVNIIHSYPDKYFESAKENFKKNKVDKSLWPCNTGCYTSISDIKQRYRKIEKELFLVEKMASSAHLLAGLEYPLSELKDAERDMIFSQFHDILPGTLVKNASDAAIRMLDHGLEILSRVKTRAFFKLANMVEYKANGNYPIFVYNPLPYPVNKTIEVEFQLADQNWEDNFTFMHVYDKNGNLLPSQIEKEACNLNLDWRKHVTFNATLNPMSINLFECRPYKVNSLKDYPSISGLKTFKCGELDVVFNFDTGLIDSIKKNGKEYLESPGFNLTVFSDSEDPWAMNQDEKLGELIGRFNLANKELTKELTGVNAPINPVRIIEDGDVRTVVEAVFTYNKSNAYVKYYFNKNESMIDLEIKVLFNENSKCLKLEVPSIVNNHLFGQQMFGAEELVKDKSEVIYHDYVGLFNDNYTDGLFMINNGTYGGSYDDDKLYLSILRTPAYTGHPINDRPVLKQDRYTDRIDLGLHEFKYRIGVGDTVTAEREAYLNENKPFALSFFTSGGKDANGKTLFTLSNEKIELVSLTMNNEKIKVRLYNGTKNKETAILESKELGIKKEITLNGYEFNEYLF